MNIYLFSISSHPKATSINSLSIKFLKPKIDFKNYDYLIVTSKQTSKSLKQYEKEDYINIPALCVSTQSALSYEKLGGKVLDIGGGYGDNLISKIKEFPKETKWLYLRAKIVASDFVEQCNGDGYNIDEIIVYESECSSEILDVDIEENSVLIFTSPSSVNCFLKNHTIKKENNIVVIGKTTAKALPKNFECFISEKTTIESCMEIALKL
ncbi:MAG: uroporphyrinogen-III synthase [Campylobacterota bacterium]|nr:uroporphyrinogen-III synthase [Campylobacterota bacterium]